MKRSVLLSALVVMFLATFLWTLEAWARAGGSRSSGSRGSRSFSAPVKPSPSPTSPSRQAMPPSSMQQPTPQRAGWMSGLMGGIGGFMLGGLLGSLLFGGLGGGLFGGIGLLEILLIGGLLYFAFAYLRRRQQTATAAPYGYAAPRDYESPRWQSGEMSGGAATVEAPAEPSDLERGIGHIRQMDEGFDPVRFASSSSAIFPKLQAAWTARDMSSVRQLLTAEMYETLQKDCDRMRSERRIDRLENITLRVAEVTEAWQESGQDFVTVHLVGSMLDFTVDETTNQVVEGSRTDPVEFEEYWTFVRPVGPNTWKLSAIQQAE